MDCELAERLGPVIQHQPVPRIEGCAVGAWQMRQVLLWRHRVRRERWQLVRGHWRHHAQIRRLQIGDAESPGIANEHSGAMPAGLARCH